MNCFCQIISRCRFRFHQFNKTTISRKAILNSDEPTFTNHGQGALLKTPSFRYCVVHFSTDGNVDQGMIVFMMTLSFLIPACGVLCLLWKGKVYRVVNAGLAVIVGLFNIAHAFMELPSDNAGQYVVLPMMIVIGFLLAWNSIKYVKENESGRP